MGSIRIISASAGSGKTHELTTVLLDALASGRVRPEAVVATTFTVKAAEELRHRARRHLLEHGAADAARRLGAARIGTINSICDRLVADHAFDLGLSPRSAVMDEAVAAHALKRAQSRALSPEQKQELSRLSGRLNQKGRLGESSWDWNADVGAIIERARANDVTAADLAECCRRSRESIRDLLGARGADGDAIKRRLEEAIDGYVGQPARLGDTTKATRGVVRLCSDLRRMLRWRSGAPWHEWVKVSKATAKVGAKSRDAFAPVAAAAARHDEHPRLHDDVDRAIELVFGAAARSLESYERYKREHGLIDFVDQEVLALELLRDERVAARLRDEIDLLLVDEFQDTSPIELAIFLRLAELANEAVWVGDQKQAIYAFRGTDPSLMDAVVGQMLEGDPGTTLTTSYRSRPELVHVTSDVFVPPFAEHGIAERRVRLQPAGASEPGGLGPVLERWGSDTRNKPDDAAALAAGVRELLADPGVRVRDRLTRDARDVRPGDVAVLCRTNALCADVAAALTSVGVPVRLARSGLLTTIEARVAVSALRLWADQRDAQAAAELVRLVEYPDRGDAWVSAIVRRPGAAAFAEAPTVRAVGDTRTGCPTAGPVEALDLVVGAVGLLDLCRRWGGSATRLANVEALRRRAAAFATERAADGGGATVAAFVRHLEDLADDEADHRGVAETEDAVTVSTWHGAKGLEWPVTVLNLADEVTREMPAVGVHVATDRERIDLGDPLAGRWIRYWPSPYGQQWQGTPFHERITEHPANAAAIAAADREALRLLYVGWTRARDRVVLAGRAGKLDAGPLQHLTVDGGPAAVTEPDGSLMHVGGRDVTVVHRRTAPGDALERTAAPDPAYALPVERALVGAHATPSSLRATGGTGAPVRLGERLELHGAPSMDAVGEAVHRFLAADRIDRDPAERRAVAGRLLDGWGVPDALDADALLDASERFASWADATWPGARWRRELPVLQRLAGGTVLRGFADLVLETDAGVAVVDHKTFPGTTAQATERAAGHAGQLSAYGSALAAAIGKPLLGTFIHMPVVGIVLPIEGAAS